MSTFLVTTSEDILCVGDEAKCLKEYEEALKSHKKSGKLLDEPQLWKKIKPIERKTKNK